MEGLPIISVRSPILQSDLGVKTVKSARRKLAEFGATIIDKEYVLKSEIEQLFKEKIRHSSTTYSKLTKGSSFEEYL